MHCGLLTESTEAILKLLQKESNDLSNAQVEMAMGWVSHFSVVTPCNTYKKCSQEGLLHHLASAAIQVAKT